MMIICQSPLLKSTKGSLKKYKTIANNCFAMHG